MSSTSPPLGYRRAGVWTARENMPARELHERAAMTLAGRAPPSMAHEGRGLRHQADEVARRLAAGELESPLMGLDETVSIAATMDTVLAQARAESII